MHLQGRRRAGRTDRRESVVCRDQGHLNIRAGGADLPSAQRSGAIPGFKLSAPTYIAQGSADTFVLEQVTTNLVNMLAARGSPVSYRTYAAGDHGTIVMDAKNDVLAFIAARFAN